MCYQNSVRIVFRGSEQLLNKTLDKKYSSSKSNLTSIYVFKVNNKNAGRK